MNILHKLLLLLSLSMSPAVTVSAAAEYTDFDTFQTAEKYLADFDYLNENSYRLSFNESFENNIYHIDYEDDFYVFYVFPIYYNIVITNRTYITYYQNEYYYFLKAEGVYYEQITRCYFSNYIGSETELSFLALDHVGMSQVIDHDYTQGYYDDTTIYGSFYKFFTGFFPEYVVTEYHGIFTFIVVGFLLFLVFGFVFFLFRVIRRLVGFK